MSSKKVKLNSKGLSSYLREDKTLAQGLKRATSDLKGRMSGRLESAGHVYIKSSWDGTRQVGSVDIEAAPREIEKINRELR